MFNRKTFQIPLARILPSLPCMMDSESIQCSSSISTSLTIDSLSSGGPGVADHASKNLHVNLVSSPAFQAGNYEKAVHDAIQAEEKQLFDGFVNGKNDASGSGSTVSLALIDLTKAELVIASLGDSHISLGEQKKGGDGFITKPVSESLNWNLQCRTCPNT